jgi:hypothetical protein
MEMIKYITFLLLLSSCTNIKDKPITFSGNTSYIKNETESMNSKLKLEYRHKLYEPKNKKWESHITGTVVTDYDHFNNQMKNNTFTTLGFEF